MTDIQIDAAFCVIGDEILSGRTKDKNIGVLAEVLTNVGIELKEVRIVSDDEAAIIEAVNQLRMRYTYVFTSGGIGPTHDDITAEAIAKAFDLPCEKDAKAMEILTAHYAAREMDFTEARQRMARMPKGASHIDNPVSKAPGFIIGNVHVMAGVPSIFLAMLDNVLPTLKTSAKLLSDSVVCGLGEGTIGTELGEIQQKHSDTLIGSYPRYDGMSFTTEIVVRSREQAAINAAILDVKAMIERLTTV